jgi:hypothetical protein
LTWISCVAEQATQIKQYLRGHYAYYGVGGNIRSLFKIYRIAERYWHRMLCSHGSNCCAVSQIPKSVVREIRTLRSVGVGTTFSVVPSTRRQLGNRLFYRDKSFLAIALADKMMDNIFLNG